MASTLLDLLSRLTERSEGIFHRDFVMTRMRPGRMRIGLKVPQSY